MALTKYNYNSFDITPVASKALAFNSDADGFTTATEGSMVLIKTMTASTSADLTFVNGADDVVLDSTYPTYVFKFINLHTSADSSALTVNFRDGGSSYDATKTTIFFLDKLLENDTGGELSYKTGLDLAQSTAIQKITVDADNANDAASSGEMWLFNPSSTTFVKNFWTRINELQTNAGSMECWTAGYCNVTAAIDAVQFSVDSGTIDSGTITLYGIKDS